MNIDFPKLVYYDQDFIQAYQKTWLALEEYWTPAPATGKEKCFFFHKPNSTVLSQFDVTMASFALVYQNKPQLAQQQMDFFYRRQESSGAIRSHYDFVSMEPVEQEGNCEGVHPPLFSWVEYHLYHKTGTKKRLQEVLPVLEKYFAWIDQTFRDKERGILKAPLAAVGCRNSPREDDGALYLIDFNAQQLLNAHCIAAIGTLLNDKELAFRYQKYFFALKIKMVEKMWDAKSGFFYDLDVSGNRIPSATLSSYWMLLCNAVSWSQLDLMIEKLRDPKWFGSENPFPSLAQSHPNFSAEGKEHYGAVHSHLNYIVIKGLEAHKEYRLAREYTILHFYHILDTYFLKTDFSSFFWSSYKPYSNEPALQWDQGEYRMADCNAVHMNALITVNLFIENIIGLHLSLPRKTVDWIVPTLEEMGVRNLMMRRNMISMQTKKNIRGWEIRLESEKLYYFSIDILDYKKKTLPIPSGKCSMLIDKL